MDSLLLFISFFLLILFLSILIWFWILNNEKTYDDSLVKLEISLIDRYYSIRNLIFYKKFHELEKYCDNNMLNIIKKLKDRHIMISTSYYNVVKIENKFFLKVMGRSIYENILDDWIFEEKEGNLLLVGIS